MATGNPEAQQWLRAAAGQGLAEAQCRLGLLLAQGVPLFEAAALAVSLHARAGDMAAECGERGLLASELWAPLRRLLNPGAVLS